MAYSQPAIEWQQCYGGTSDDFPINIFQTKDGGYFAAGISSSIDFHVAAHHGDKFTPDCWIVKLDEKGKKIWDRSIGGQRVDQLLQCIETIDGGCIFTGYTNSFDGDIQGRTTKDDLYHMLICKLTAKGIIDWLKVYEDSIQSTGVCLIQTFDGGYVISKNGKKPVLLKIDALGNKQWERNNFVFNDIIRTSDSGFIGCTAIEAPSRTTDILVVKMSSTGHIEWQKAYGGSEDEYARCIIQLNSTESTQYAICGSTSSNDGDVTGFHPSNNHWQDGWIFMISETGQLIWQKALGGSGWDDCSSVRRTNNGQFVIMGTTSSGDGDVTEHYGNEWNFCPWLIKMDTKGNIVWQHSYITLTAPATGNYGRMASQTSDNGYIFTSDIYGDGGDVSGFHGPKGTSDFWVVKLAPEVLDVPSSLSSLKHISIFPNPTKGLATVHYSLTVPMKVRIDIYDLFGESVNAVKDTYEQEGEHSLSFDLSNLSSGKYFLRFEHNAMSEVTPFEIIR